MSEADKRQEGGSHYKGKPILPQVTAETWNLIIPMGWSAFQFEIINYVDRYKRKGGIEDLKKARHWLDKLIEVETTRAGTDSIPASEALVVHAPAHTIWEEGSFTTLTRVPRSEGFICKDCNQEFSPRDLCTCNKPVMHHPDGSVELTQSSVVTGDKCCKECGAQPGKAHGPH